MAKLDENSACVGPAGFHHDFFRWRYLLASLASVVLGIVPAGLAWAQDGIECRPGTHCAPHPIGKPCFRCIPDAPPAPPTVCTDAPPPPPTPTVVDWRNNNSGCSSNNNSGCSSKKSGHEDGTASNPFRTLRRAARAAYPGDTLSIRTGFYNTEEPLVLDKALHIRAENGPVTIYAHRTDDILISMDIPGNQPPAGDGEICQGGLYAQGGLVPNEWMQPPGGEALPALGLVVDKSDPDDDLRWDHPFGFDYWWSVAFYGDDNPYLSLLNKLTLSSTMDCSPQGISQKRGETDTCNARCTSQVEPGRDPSGILHTEMEDRLLPFPYRPLPGDRVYMRGHRIVDCGHDPYGAEMHPPTLVVAARVSPDDGSLRTTVLAAPYLTTQSYENGKDFPTAATAGIVSASFSPAGLPFGLPLVTHTSSRPFNVPIVAKYSVAVPTVPHRATALNLHYHFVTRPGVRVNVTPDPAGALRADVEIRMDPAAYQPFSDANCHKETIGLKKLDEDWHKPDGTIQAALFGIGSIGLPPPALFTLAAGIQVAVCGDPNPTPGTPGTINDNEWVIDAKQPYPVYGWLSYD